jgi:hypothetical protein
MNRDDIDERMLGRWDEYFLSRLNIDVEDWQSTSCFICEAKSGDGGKDRFSWTNHKDRGGYYCWRLGDPHHGDGFALVEDAWEYLLGQPLSWGGLLRELTNWLDDNPSTIQRRSPKVNTKIELTRVTGDCSNTARATHPYLVGKKLSVLAPFDPTVGVTNGLLAIPQAAYDDPFGDVVGIELISPDGTKRMVKGSRKGVHIMPTNPSASQWLIVEGWATGLALVGALKKHRRDDYRVAVCGGKGKMTQAASHLPNARCIYEDDGLGTPEGELAFPCNEDGNDIADHYHNAALVAAFIEQL